MYTLTLDPPTAPIPRANGHSVMPHPDPRPADPAVAEPGPAPLTPGWVSVTVAIGVMAALIALGGMVLSFRAVSTEMAPAFGAQWAWLVPIVVDLTVFVFSGVDLVLARLDMGHPLARWTVYGATFGTVYLNYAAGGTPAGRIAHVLMPSIWVVFTEIMRHVVRTQVGLTTGTRRDPVPAARWLLAPVPTFKLWRRMVLWRVNSYTTALAMERTRLGAIATARQNAGRLWRFKVSPLTRMQIAMGEADANAVRAAVTAATSAENTATAAPTSTATTMAADPASTAADERPGTGQQHGHDPAETTANDPATPSADARPTTGHPGGRVAVRRPATARVDNAAAVAKTAAKHPEWGAAKIATHLGIGERTARRHMTGH